MTTWSHRPFGKYLLIEWRAADHGTDVIDRGELKAIGPDVAGSTFVIGGVVVFRSGSATQTGPLINGQLQMLVHVDNIVATATPVTP